MKKLKGSAGFSLIEVVAATAVIGMLAAMVIPSLNGVYERARNAKLANDMAAIDSAIILFKMDEGKLPEKLEDLIDEYLDDKKSVRDAIAEFNYEDNEDGTYTLEIKDESAKEEVEESGSSGEGTN